MGSMLLGTARREARLRPEFAGQYPGVAAGRWECAATLADRVLAAALLRGWETRLWRRLLPEEHFDFRGGVARCEGGDSGRPRREDR
jgi:hypothetical protein